MKKYLPVILVAILIISALGIWFFVFNDNDKKQNSETSQVNNNSQTEQNVAPTTSNTTEAETSAKKGSYITYEEYQNNKNTSSSDKVVYFFNAKWCPTCKVLNENLTKNQGNIPNGVTIVSVDYDTYADLKKQYGVTYQHTLVQVDSNGNQIKKWSGGNSLESVLEQI
jgi:thiol-disulfide isomerase/thioredoxin